MPTDTDMQFHAQRLAENPAWRHIIGEAREDLRRTSNRLPLHARDERWATTVAETMLDRLEHKARVLADSGSVERFHAEMETKVA